MKIAKTSAAKAMIAALVAAAAGIAQAQTTTWKIDPAHSSADFSVKHMGISNIHGHFGGVAGTVTLDAKDLAKSAVTATSASGFTIAAGATVSQSFSYLAIGN